MCQIISATHLGLTLFKTTSVHSILTQVKREAVLNESDDSSGVYLPSNAVSPFVHQLDQCILYNVYYVYYYTYLSPVVHYSRY